MCYETDSESDEISITSFSVTCCTEQTDIAYRTAEHYSYVNTAAVTSDHNEISITSFSITCCTEQD